MCGARCLIGRGEASKGGRGVQGGEMSIGARCLVPVGNKYKIMVLLQLCPKVILVNSRNKYILNIYNFKIAPKY